VYLRDMYQLCCDAVYLRDMYQLCCDAVYFERHVPTFQRNSLPLIQGTTKREAVSCSENIVPIYQAT